jgi:hypothetical protein
MVMKQLRTISILWLFVISTNAQTLHDQMWKFAGDCRESIKNPDFEDNTYDSLVDDSKNGYLFLRGSWPTCGCSCENTIGAYKKKDNTYILLKKEIWTCSWKNGLYSNVDLAKILPAGFGLKSFTEKGDVPKVVFNDGQFYFDVEIPHVGTETKLEIKLIPFGINAKCPGGLCYSFEEQSGQTKYLQYLKEFVNKVKSNESLMLILANRSKEMDATDLKLLNSIIKNSGENYNMAELEMDLKNIFFIYKTWQKLYYTTVILKWDRESGRFIIKEKKGQILKLDFLEFLKNAPWYSPAC